MNDTEKDQNALNAQKEWTSNRLRQLRNERVRSISTSYDEPDVVVEMEVGGRNSMLGPSPNVHHRFSRGSTPMSQMLASRIPNSQSLHEGEIQSTASCITNPNVNTTSNKIGPEEFIEMMRRRKKNPFQSLRGRRRTVSENQASLMLMFPQSLRLKYITGANQPPPNTNSNLIVDRQPVSRHDSITPDSPFPSDGMILVANDSRKFIHQSGSGGRLMAVKHSMGHDPMSNYPKMQVGSPISPLNEFSLYGRSPSEHMVIWKEGNKKNKIIKISATEDESIEEELTTCCLETLIESIIRRHTAYDVMPNHARVIILDLNLKVGSAFDALAYDGIHAAPLWDNNIKEFVGMITVTDFIRILQQYLHQPEVLASIRDDKVCKWRDYLLNQQQQQQQPTTTTSTTSTTTTSTTTPTTTTSTSSSSSASTTSCNNMLTITSDSNLDDLITHLQYFQIHRVVVVDPITKNALYIATYKRVLHYIWGQLPPLIHKHVTTNVFNKSIHELNIGSYHNLVSVSLSTPVHEIFTILMTRRLSAIPVVDESYRVVDVFRKADVMSLIIDGSFQDLYCPVEDVLSYDRNGFEGVYKCKRTDVVYDVIQSFVHLELHRLMVVDDDGRLEGIITTSDIIKFFLDGEHTAMSDDD